MKSTQMLWKVKATNRLAAPLTRKNRIQAMLRRVQIGCGRLMAWPIMRWISGVSPMKWLAANPRANSQLTIGAFHLRKVSLWNTRVRLPNARQATRVSHWPLSSLRWIRNRLP
ncbi:hypothetical protein D9M70_496510 [compost metagenome]